MIKKTISVLVAFIVFLSCFPTSVFASDKSQITPFTVIGNNTELAVTKVGTANVPELDAELCELIGYAPGAYLVSIPYGCDTVKVKATDASLIMGETSDSQVLTDATPDDDGYYTINIAITDDKITSESQWVDDGFEFFMNPDVPLFNIEEGKIPTEDVEGFFYYFLKEYANSEIEFNEVLPDAVIIFQRSTVPSGEQPNANKTELGALISDACSNYYKENDRYNGNDADTITDTTSGFWAELTADDGPLALAQAVYENVNATQDQVDSAAATLSAAIAKLIPISQLNATKLYEYIVQYGNYSDSTLAKRTEYTANAYRTAVQNANDYQIGRAHV